MKGKNDIKCCACGKKLAEAQITNGWVNIRCKCGANNLISVTPEKKEEVQAAPEKREYSETPKTEGFYQGIYQKIPYAK